MRIIIELDNNYDVNAVSQFLKILSPENISIQTSPIKRSSIELESFFDFVEKHRVKVDDISIPSREERNAR